jgi:hypothetical protein
MCPKAHTDTFSSHIAGATLSALISPTFWTMRSPAPVTIYLFQVVRTLLDGRQFVPWGGIRRMPPRREARTDTSSWVGRISGQHLSSSRAACEDSRLYVTVIDPSQLQPRTQFQLGVDPHTSDGYHWFNASWNLRFLAGEFNIWRLALCAVVIRGLLRRIHGLTLFSGE